MHFPEKNSRGMAILKALRREPLTLWQGIEQHGEFVTPARPHGIGYDGVLTLYCALIDRGCLVREGIKYRLTLAARIRLEKLDGNPPKTSVATPRVSSGWQAPALRHPAELSGRYKQLNFKIIQDRS